MHGHAVSLNTFVEIRKVLLWESGSSVCCGCERENHGEDSA